MPLPPVQRIKFFVFVIESPSAVDLYHRRSEGDIIRQAVELNGIGCVVKTAISLQALDACLKIGLSEAMTIFTDCIPLLHISAHGNETGIQLSDGHIMDWEELKKHLIPVNKALNGSLVVCMSSCEGYSGTQMAMESDQNSELPFFYLIGSGNKPTWAETAVGFATFYHQLCRGEYIEDAVRAMQIASGNNMFWAKSGEDTRESYIEFINKSSSPEEVQANLEELAKSESIENQENLKLLSSLSAK